MPFDYGSRELNLQNPFRLEGALASLRGSVAAILGVVLLLSVRDQIVAGGGAHLGWLQLAGGLVLLAAGIASLGIGILRASRFYIGRNIPSDLAPTGNGKHSTLYTREQLKEMLMGRKNLTFPEPQSWLERTLLSVLPRLLFLPMPLRTNILRLAEAMLLTLGVFVVLGLALFSGSAGLTRVTTTAVGDVMGWLTVVAVLAIWWRRRPRSGWLRRPGGVHLSIVKLVQGIALAVLAPAVLTVIDQAAPMPPVAVSPVPWIAGALVVSVAAFGYGVVLAMARMPAHDPATDVSEFRESWQVTLHPMDIFRAFDMSMADNRFLEIPNRVYESYDPALVTNDSKGNFSGSVVQEVQPHPVQEGSGNLKLAALLAGQVVGQLMLLAGAVATYLLCRGLPTATPESAFESILPVLLLLLFGDILVATSHAYAAEISFDSFLVHFFANGTFNRSTISTGMAITDSTRSQNELIRASLTPWLVGARVRSSTFAVSGNDNLEQARYVLEMHKHDGFLQALVDDLRNFIQTRQHIADIQSPGDLAAATSIHFMNEATRGPTDPQARLAAGAARNAPEQLPRSPEPPTTEQ